MDEPVATTAKSKKIEVINKDTVHRICSGQVVIDLAVAIKELVENSLDSGATTIDIRLTDYGKTCISVSDNGSGVLEEDFEGLALKHHTSKLHEFSDLNEVDTFGFRGEALSSLCALSDLSIVTKHVGKKHGFKLDFDKNGVLKSKEAYAREQGTTVQVKNIFKNLPVRAKEFQKNIKKEYMRAIQMLYGYCLVCVNKRITCINTISGKSSNHVLSTRNSDTVLGNIGAVFGQKSHGELIQVELRSPDEATLEEYNLSADSSIDFDWECYVSSCDHAVGRSAPDRQFFYVNGRPCDLVKVSKLINNVYHKYNNKQYPFVFLNLKLNQQCTDINVTPDKRTIFLTHERLILASIKYNLTKKWDNTQGTFTVKPLTELNFSVKREISPINRAPPAKRIQLSNPDNEKSIKIRRVEVNNVKREETSKTAETIVQTVVEIPININTIRKNMQERQRELKYFIDKEKKIKYKAQINISQNSEAEKELQRELTKDSFKQMEVIGQFNLGFLITRLEDDLFIIDQHATDEKFRFEKLCNETKLKTQKLIVPKVLQFSSLNEMILIEHQEIFQNNGFEFKINTEADTGKRVELIGMPVSGGWQFGQEDIEELIFLVKEGGANTTINGEIPRPSRVRQMLASRACRSAVMIGTALNNMEMQRLIAQMAEMKNPWNCPHGRPTMRHLLSLFLLNK